MKKTKNFTPETAQIAYTVVIEKTRWNAPELSEQWREVNSAILSWSFYKWTRLLSPLVSKRDASYKVNSSLHLNNLKYLTKLFCSPKDTQKNSQAEIIHFFLSSAAIER